MKFLTLRYLLIAFVAVPTLATSQIAQDLQTRCKDSNPETRLAACTQIIEGTGSTSAEVRARALGERGKAYMMKDQLLRAIEDFDASIKGLPRNAEVHTDRGTALMRSGRLDESIAAYTTAIEITPDDALAYLNRGLAKAFAEKHSDAVSDFELAIKYSKPQSFCTESGCRPHNPLAAAAYKNQGDSYNTIGQYSSAVAAYTASLGLDPANVNALSGRSVANQQLNNVEAFNRDISQIVDLYTQFLSKNPSSVGALVNRCLYRTIQNQLQMALADCQQALKIQPASDFAIVIRGLVHLKLGNEDAALLDFEANLQRHPKNATAMYGRSLIRRHRGDVAGSKSDYAAALELSPKIESQFARYGIKTE